SGMPRNAKGVSSCAAMCVRVTDATDGARRFVAACAVCTGAMLVDPLLLDLVPADAVLAGTAAFGAANGCTRPSKYVSARAGESGAPVHVAQRT
ncbi:MAG TPA: hypothetical protein VED85_01830, partial [Burkholderiaceae bacterium]|nr:hypothetical protein [Burkholderiaceae bacterium]